MPPSIVVPEGTTIAVRHFLSVPNCQEVEEATTSSGSCHSILKVTRSMKKEKLDMEVIHSEGNISSAYISTDKFQNISLCKIVVAGVPWGSEKAVCRHTSLKKIVVTKHKEVCSHTPYALAVYCHCESATEDFKKLIKERCHQPTGAVMVQDIAKNEEISYDIAVQLSDAEVEEGKRVVSHSMLCKNNGVVQLGKAIQDRFQCTCKNPHCDDANQICITATNSVTGEVSEYSNILVCDKSKEGKDVEANQALGQVHRAPIVCAEAQIALAKKKPTFNQIMEEEIIRPHRPGGDFSNVMI